MALVAMTFCPAAKTGDEEIASKKQDLRRRRSPIFEYPALPEMKLCYAVVFCAMIYAWYCVYSASTKWQFKIGHAASITRLPFIGPRFKVNCASPLFNLIHHVSRMRPTGSGSIGPSSPCPTFPTLSGTAHCSTSASGTYRL